MHEWILESRKPQQTAWEELQRFSTLRYAEEVKAAHEESDDALYYEFRVILNTDEEEVVTMVEGPWFVCPECKQEMYDSHEMRKLGTRFYCISCFCCVIDQTEGTF